MNSNVNTLLNTQLQKELESAYLYLNYADYFDTKGMVGFAHWYKLQAKEEISHAMKFYDFLHEINYPITLMPLSITPQKTESVFHVLKLTLEHEKYITSLINKIYSEAEKIDDYRVQDFLSWFINEQREEELQVKKLIDRYAGLCMDSKNMESGTVLYELDKEMCMRE